MDFKNLNLTGLQVLTGMRSFVTDPNEAVRTTPTQGKITLSDGFVKESGFVPNGHIVFLSLPSSFDYGIERTFPDRVEDVYALAPGFGVKENGRDASLPSFGNYLSDGSGSGVSFASAAAWSACRGTVDGSNYFRTAPVYGIAQVDGNFVAVIESNKDSIPADAPCVVFVTTVDGCALDVNNPITVAEALKGRPIYALEFVNFEPKSVREENAEGVKAGRPAKAQTAVVAEELTTAIGEDFTFNDVVGEDL
jgi:hypothetical protein